MELPVLSKIPRETKIVLVFIVCIIIPSVMLTFFALGAVESERMKVQRSQEHHYESSVRSAASKFISRLKADLEPTGRFLSGSEKGNPSEKAVVDHVLRVRDEKEIFTGAFVYKTGESLVYPSSGMESSLDIIVEPSPDIFAEAFRWEYQQKEYELAEQAYDKIRINHSGDEAVTLKAGQGAARCLFKQEKFDEAAKVYEDLIAMLAGDEELTALASGISWRIRLAECRKELGETQEYYRVLLEAYEKLVSRGLDLPEARFGFFEKSIDDGLSVLMNEKDVEKYRILKLRYQELLADKLELEKARRLGEFLTSGVLTKLKEKARSEEIGEFFIGTDGEGEWRLFACVIPAKRENYDRMVAGFELDTNYLRNKVIPEITRETGKPAGAFLVVEEEEEPLSLENDSGDMRTVAGKPFPEPFERFTVKLKLPADAVLSEGWTISNTIYFWIVIVSVVGIMAGMIFTVRTVSREIKNTRMQSDFVSNVTHELKTPLTSIQMFVETLQEGRARTDVDREEYLNIIASESRRLSRLIDRILDFSRMERGAKPYNFRPASVPTVIRKSLEALKAHLEEEKVDVHMRIPRNVPPAWMAPDAISEVLLNLLTNAIKYTKGEKKDVWITVRESRANVIIDVIDKGIGISRWEAKKIFEKFYRSDNRLAREIEGTGLGLTISRHIARAHGGDILIESKKGQGSRFSLVLKKASVILEKKKENRKKKTRRSARKKALSRRSLSLKKPEKK